MNIDFKKTVLGSAILVIALVIVVVKTSSSDPMLKTATSATPTKRPLSKRNERDSDSPKTLPGSSPNRKIRPEAPQVLSKDEIDAARITAVEKMNEASTSYDPAQLPVIQPYLEDPDPELRAAAVDAMITLGDASAGKMLRDAAQSLDSPEEAKKMQDAADYVELPPANLRKISKIIKKRSQDKKAARDPKKVEAAKDGQE